VGVGVVALTPDQLAAWVRRSCDRQGVPEHVSDPATIARVVTLLRGGTPERNRAERVSTAVPARSEAPDGPDAVGIEPAAGHRGLVDDRVVEDGLDDRRLPGQVEVRPLGL